jgi:lipopolysaccharide biosynthesis glycosyltransferase
MNVVYISDDAYAKYLGISMLSLLDHNQDMEEITVYVLEEKISEDNKAHLYKIARKYRRTIHFIDIMPFDKMISFTFDTSGYNPIVLSRLFLGIYLPNEIERILYLDCDVIINGSIKELETIPLEQNLIAAVPELYMPPEKKALIGLRKEDTYYNAGVLLINLAMWRLEKIENIFMEYYRFMKGQLLYNDQDILNHCCKGRILTLSHTYNLSPNLFYFPRYFMKRLQPAYDSSSAKEYAQILSSPAIIHYMGDERPWIAGNRNKYRRQYEYYFERSPWRGEPLIQGQKLYMFCYHNLNVITFICPWFRVLFTKLIGINKYKWFNKK